MTTHIMSMTYQEKIPAVLEGTCHQTIRAEHKIPFSVNDHILLHGWSGKPYHSPWSWRMSIELIEVITMVPNEDGYVLTDGDRIVPGHGRQKFHSNKNYAIFTDWYSQAADGLALLDGIVPPTGLELKDVLGRFVNLEDEPILKILRW